MLVPINDLVGIILYTTRLLDAIGQSIYIYNTFKLNVIVTDNLVGTTTFHRDRWDWNHQLPQFQ